MTSNNGPYMSLQNSLTEVFSNCQLNYNCCLLMTEINTVKVIKNSEQSFKILMLIPGICMGGPTHLGNVLCLPFKELKTLYHI